MKLIRGILKAYGCEMKLLVSDQEYWRKFQEMLASLEVGHTIRRTENVARIERI